VHVAAQFDRIHEAHGALGAGRVQSKLKSRFLSKRLNKRNQPAPVPVGCGAQQKECLHDDYTI
jgi:hypothetical protein